MAKHVKKLQKFIVFNLQSHARFMLLIMRKKTHNNFVSHIAEHNGVVQ